MHTVFLQARKPDRCNTRHDDKVSREQMSQKRLHRHVAKFASLHNQCSAATADQMTIVAQRMAGQRLRDQELITEDDSGLRLTAVAH